MQGPGGREGEGQHTVTLCCDTCCDRWYGIVLFVSCLCLLCVDREGVVFVYNCLPVLYVAYSTA